MYTHGKPKTLKRFLCVASHFSLFHMMHFKNTKGKKLLFFPKKIKKKVNKNKKHRSKTEGLESVVCVVGTPAS